MTTRRDFMKSLASAAAMAGVAGAPKFSFAQEAGGKTFIKVFQRGGADGLHLFPLYNDPAYREYRPDLAIPPPMGMDGGRSLSLGPIASAGRVSSGVRGMNPNFQALMEIWDAGNMMIAPATSFAGANRSHFDCQRWVGTGARDNLIDGYLNRYLQSVPGGTHPLRGMVAGKTSMSTELRGRIPVPSIRDSGSYGVTNSDLCGVGCDDFLQTDMMREIASHDVILSAAEDNIKENQLILLDSLQDVTAAADAYGEGANYSNSDLGRGLRLCAQLLKHGIPLEVAALDWNIGWDTHSNQIGDNEGVNPFTDPDKRYNARLAEGAADFLTFYRDMGAEMANIVVLVGSEFGRTKKQNGSVGTDHGQGGGWFAFGGPTQKAVAADVDTIDDTVVDRNWLPTLTSYRDIVGEIMTRHMGMSDQLISTIFPNHTFVDNSLFIATS